MKNNIKKKGLLLLAMCTYIGTIVAQDNTFYMDDNSTVTVQSGANVHVEGDFHMDADADLDNAGTIELQGDWRFEAASAKLTETGAAEEQGLVVFQNNFTGNPHNAGAAQTIYAPADMLGAGAFYDIDINNDGDLLDLNGGSIEVKNTLEFKDANDVLRTDASSHGTAGQDYAHVVYISNTDPAALVSGSGTANNATGAYIEGKLQWALAANTYTFPIGVDGADKTEPFQLAVTTVPANGTVTGYIKNDAVTTIGTTIYSDLATHGGSTGVEDFSVAAPGADGKLDKIEFDAEYVLAWQVDASTSAGWDYTFTGYPGAMMKNETFENFDSKDIAFLLKDGIPQGGTSATAPSPWAAGTDADGFQVDFNGTLAYTYDGTSFSTFRVGGSTNLSNDVAVPVELLSFDGRALGEHNQLDWITASEVNVSHFEVEKSRDGIIFGNIGREVARGNSAANTSYRYLDSECWPLAYYRLKMVDEDGSYEYSNTIILKRDDKDFGFSIYPNPTKGEFVLDAIINPNAKAEVNVFDPLGRLVSSRKLFSDAEGRLLANMGMESFAPGAYTVRLNSENSHDVLILIREE